MHCIPQTLLNGVGLGAVRGSAHNIKIQRRLQLFNKVNFEANVLIRVQSLGRWENGTITTRSRRTWTIVAADYNSNKSLLKRENGECVQSVTWLAERLSTTIDTLPGQSVRIETDENETIANIYFWRTVWCLAMLVRRRALNMLSYVLWHRRVLHEITVSGVMNVFL